MAKGIERMPAPMTVLTTVMEVRKKSIYGVSTGFLSFEAAGEYALLSILISTEFIGMYVGVFIVVIE